MFGIWSALTPLGKLALVGAVLLGLGFFALIYNNKGNNNAGLVPELLRSLTVTAPAGQQIIDTARTSTPRATVTSPGGTPVPGAAISPTPESSTPPAEEPTSTEAPAATQPAQATEPPTEVPTPIPPSPTPVPPTPTPGCEAVASVSASGDNAANGTLTCNGAGVSGASMNAFFTFESGGTACLAITDDSGAASCSPKGAESFGALVSVQVCFSHDSQQVCATTQP